jgi:cell division protein ZapD
LTDCILYEFPLNERIRLFMRLDQLFQEIEYFLGGSSAWDSRSAMSSLIQVVTLFARYDLKSELLKEIDRHMQVWQKLRANPRVDGGRLDELLNQLEQSGAALYGLTGKLGQELIEADLIKLVTQRSSMPGGSCSFDLPSFHYWLEQDCGKRRSDLQRWLAPFATVKSTVRLLLSLLRSSATASSEIAHGGFFQKTLDHTLSFQLLRIQVDRQYPCFAEISGGKHRVTVRMLTHTLEQQPSLYRDDVAFRLTCCSM